MKMESFICEPCFPVLEVNTEAAFQTWKIIFAHSYTKEFKRVKKYYTVMCCLLHAF
jgi:hypothetical protein